MLVRLIRSIRRKPKAVRNQYAFWTAASITGLILVTWLFSLTSDFAIENLSVSPADQANPAADGDSSSQSLSDFVDDIREGVASATDEVATNRSTTASPTAATETPVTRITPAESATPSVVRLATTSPTSTDSAQ